MGPSGFTPNVRLVPEPLSVLVRDGALETYAGSNPALSTTLETAIFLDQSREKVPFAEGRRWNTAEIREK